MSRPHSEQGLPVNTSEFPYHQLVSSLLENYRVKHTPSLDLATNHKAEIPVNGSPEIPASLAAMVTFSATISRCFVGIPKATPYSSQPLLTAIQSSPEIISFHNIIVLKHYGRLPGLMPSVFGDLTGARIVMPWMITLLHFTKKFNFYPQ
uniref:Uncharacterized protein n=1 Tax=Solanum lycopersicum TaxID=4081 RepID=A0A3Q7HWB0_SOLLC